jgi:hypothetical protein
LNRQDAKDAEVGGREEKGRSGSSKGGQMKEMALEMGGKS